MPHPGYTTPAWQHVDGTQPCRTRSAKFHATSREILKRAPPCILEPDLWHGSTKHKHCHALPAPPSSPLPPHTTDPYMQTQHTQHRSPRLAAAHTSTMLQSRGGCCGASTTGPCRPAPAPHHAPSAHTRRSSAIAAASAFLRSGAPEPPGAASSSGRLSSDVRLPLGRLVVRPIELGDVQAASVVLTRAFAGSAEAVSLSDVSADIDAALGDGSHGGAFLVARLYPTDGTPLPPGQDSRLVGTATLSLDPSALPLQRLPPVNLPPRNGGAAYISNMAVDSKFRRHGIARAMLGLCEEAARMAGKREAWLHVREADGAARALYASVGYVEVVKDGWFDQVKHNMRPRILMKRSL